MKMIDGHKLILSLNDWWYSTFGLEENEKSKAIKEVIEAVGAYVNKVAESEEEALEQESIIRCKDCKHWHEWENGTGSCHRSGIMWVGSDYDDYCSFAERKEQ